MYFLNKQKVHQIKSFPVINNISHIFNDQMKDSAVAMYNHGKQRMKKMQERTTCKSRFRVINGHIL